MTSIAFAVVVIGGQAPVPRSGVAGDRGLARVDVVCADKTGTLTENGMRLSEVDVAPGGSGETAVKSALSAMAASDPRPNASVLAIRESLSDDSGGAKRQR